jgi:hypothetical protein
MRAAIVLLLAGCSTGDSLVVVTVGTTTPLPSAAVLHTVSSAGGRMSPHDLTLPSPLAPGMPTSFGVQVPSTITGAFGIHVEAHNSGGALLAEGDGMATLSPGQRTDVTVTLGASIADGGSDGAVNDLSVRDLAMPDLSVQILVVNPDHKDFGSLNEGSASTEQSFRVSNVSAASAGILTLAITGPNAAQFVLSTDMCSSNPLFSMTSCNFGVTFHPALAGARSAAVTITSNTLGVIGSIPLTGASVGLQGRACTVDADCQSWAADGGSTLGGHCVDGYCCDRDATTCSGCRACNVNSLVGTCSPVPVGTDPRSFCTQACANKCDGAGACKPTTSGTTCMASKPCANTNLVCTSMAGPGGVPQYQSAGFTDYLCDGVSLNCPAGGTARPCSGNLACDTTGNCKPSCSSDGDCLYDHYCNGGTCVQAPIAGTCTRQAQCGDALICSGGQCVGCATDHDCWSTQTEPLCLPGGNCGFGCSCGSSCTNNCGGSGWGSLCGAFNGACGCSSNADCTWDNAPNCLSWGGGMACGCFGSGNPQKCRPSQSCVSGGCYTKSGYRCCSNTDCVSGTCMNNICL